MVCLVGEAWHIVWPGGHIGNGLTTHSMVYCMAWQCMALCIIWPDGHGMIHGMAWWPWLGICYGLAWQASHGILYGLASMSWYVESHRITSIKALPWVIVPFTHGVADVNWRSCSHVPDPFKSKGPFTCMFRSHVQLLFILGKDSK